MLSPGSSLFAKVSVEGFNNYFTFYIPMLSPGSSLFAKVSVEGFNNYFTIYIPMLLRKQKGYC